MIREAQSVLKDTHAREHLAGLQYLEAGALMRLGKLEEAVARAHEAVELGRSVAWAELHRPQTLLGALLVSQRRIDEAIPILEEAATALEVRRTWAVALGAQSRTEFIAGLRTRDPFPVLVDALVTAGRVPEALVALERGRGRELLDMMERGRVHPLEVVSAQALARADQSLVARIDAASQAVSDAEVSMAAARRAVSLAEEDVNRSARRRSLQVLRKARASLTEALQRRQTLVRDAIPEGRLLREEEFSKLLRDNERILAYSLGHPSYVFLVSETATEAYRLPSTPEAVHSAVEQYVAMLGVRGTDEAKRTDAGKALFDLLVPAQVWKDLGSARHVIVLPHGALHRLPFEALVWDAQGGTPTYWVDTGPTVSYAGVRGRRCTPANAAAGSPFRGHRTCRCGPEVRGCEPVA